MSPTPWEEGRGGNREEVLRKEFTHEIPSLLCLKQQMSPSFFSTVITSLKKCAAFGAHTRDSFPLELGRSGFCCTSESHVKFGTWTHITFLKVSLQISGPHMSIPPIQEVSSLFFAEYPKS
jgi:hypothetical protein